MSVTGAFKVARFLKKVVGKEALQRRDLEVSCLLLLSTQTKPVLMKTLALFSDDPNHSQLWTFFRKTITKLVASPIQILTCWGCELGFSSLNSVSVLETASTFLSYLQPPVKRELLKENPFVSEVSRVVVVLASRDLRDWIHPSIRRR